MLNDALQNAIRSFDRDRRAAGPSALEEFPGFGSGLRVERSGNSASGQGSSSTALFGLPYTPAEDTLRDRLGTDLDSTRECDEG